MRRALHDKVRDFYEQNPYPSQRLEGAGDLVSSGHHLVMKKILLCAGLSPESLHGLRVLDAGCGTGEKAIYCSLKGAKVDAFDFSRNSIRIARQSSAKLGAKAAFIASSFEAVRLREKYDLILCIGSLHHTDDPEGNFLRMASHLPKGGAIVLGLYNFYGRLACRLHRQLLWLGETDPQRVIEKIGAHREKSPARRAQLADRFAVPHETYHTIEEVLGWMKQAGLRPLSTEPKVRLNSAFDIKLSQLSWLAKRKGFFFISAKRPQQ